MQKTIAFLTTGHTPFDDRIYYHLADSLRYLNPVIIAGTTDLFHVSDEITFDCFSCNNLNTRKKIDLYVDKLHKYEPCLIICSEPLAIIAAKTYKRRYNKKIKIVYDITEWYSGKIKTESIPYPAKFIKKILLSVFNLYAATFANAFIFGEYYKSIRYRLLFPFKKWEIITYYPNLKYINYKPFRPIKQSLCLGYTGRLNNEKGIGNFFRVIKIFQNNHPDIKLYIKIIGWFINEKDKLEYNESKESISNIEIEFLDGQLFENFSDSLCDMDILFDLRQMDFENNHSLPIKLFYYAACGKPVIYSNLKAIRREVDIESFGFLVDPKNSETISELILKYIEDPLLYEKHCKTAREISEGLYNWNNIEPKLNRFIYTLINNTDR